MSAVSMVNSVTAKPLTRLFSARIRLEWLMNFDGRRVRAALRRISVLRAGRFPLGRAPDAALGEVTSH